MDSGSAGFRNIRESRDARDMSRDDDVYTLGWWLDIALIIFRLHYLHSGQV